MNKFKKKENKINSLVLQVSIRKDLLQEMEEEDKILRKKSKKISFKSMRPKNNL
jgi:hypothetical protein